jgi:hypothetical protein
MTPVLHGSHLSELDPQVGGFKVECLGVRWYGCLKLRTAEFDEVLSGAERVIEYCHNGSTVEAREEWKNRDNSGRNLTIVIFVLIGQVDTLSLPARVKGRRRE